MNIDNFFTRKKVNGVLNSEYFDIFYKVLEAEKQLRANQGTIEIIANQVFDEIVTPANIVALNKMKREERLARKRALEEEKLARKERQNLK